MRMFEAQLIVSAQLVPRGNMCKLSHHALDFSEFLIFFFINNVISVHLRGHFVICNQPQVLIQLLVSIEHLQSVSSYLMRGEGRGGL